MKEKKKKKKNTKNQKNIKKKINTKNRKKKSNTKNNKKATQKINKKKKQDQAKEYNEIERKTKKIIISLIIILVIIIAGTLIYKYLYVAPNISIKEVYLLDDSKVIIEFKRNGFSLKNKVYCYYTKEEKKPDIVDNNWILSENNKCHYNLDSNIYHVYLKNEDDKIIRVYQTDKIGTVKNLKINESKYYLAQKDSLELKITYDKYGYVDDNVKWTSSNESIATVKNGKVKGISNGNVIITATILGKEISSNIIVTDIIAKRPNNGFDFDKKDLTCKQYTDKENKLLDKILEFKIDKVGYKTRAGVVEAARFLTLDFPYRINYFYENGRLSRNGIDGEGRYYHKGLYLSDSKFNSIQKSRTKPQTWGCPLYSVPDKKSSSNGLDCSGFVSWALLNGGFDPGDIGAGITKIKDLTDLGTKTKLTKSIAVSSKIKVGDLLHNAWNSGHIAIIVGIDEDYYYVAQAVWFDEVGVIINKYKKKNLSSKFNEVILMDKYYKNDGELTNMW